MIIERASTGLRHSHCSVYGGCPSQQFGFITKEISRLICKCYNDFIIRLNLPHSIHDLYPFACRYFFSFTTLVLNKYFLSSQNGDPIILAVCQLLACCLAGGVQLKCTRSGHPGLTKETLSSAAILGTLRFCTVLLGLYSNIYTSLKHLTCETAIL